MFYQLRAVMQKEFAGYFRTPTAYIIIAVYLVLSMFATFYSAYFFAYDNSGLISFFTYQPEIFVVLMPAATMRLWADERRSGTIEFLLTQPVDYTAVVLGKFMAAAAFGLLMLALTYIVNRTRMGRAMRAVSVDEEAAQLMGISVDRTISFTFLLGSVLAGAAGVLVGVYYNSINPLMGMTPGLKAFIAAVFGGIGIIPGAMIGGLSIGIAETLVIAYGSSLYKDAIVYVILILILIIKPAGLLGKHVKEKV